MIDTNLSNIPEPLVNSTLTNLKYNIKFMKYYVNIGFIVFLTHMRNDFYLELTASAPKRHINSDMNNIQTLFKYFNMRIILNNIEYKLEDIQEQIKNSIITNFDLKLTEDYYNELILCLEKNSEKYELKISLSKKT